jgi:hypothetical protein
MQLPIEMALRPKLHVHSYPGSTKGSISGIPPTELLRGFIGEDDHQVIVAVRASIPACRRTKQVNPERVIDLRQPPDNLAQHRSTPGRQQKAV